MLAAMVMLLSLAACGGDDLNTGSSGEASKTPETVSPTDLTGEWKQSNSNSDDTYHGIYISGDTIEVYWVMESEDMTALYWAGSFEAPSDASEPYQWESKNDTSRTASALMASGDETKTFTYENGKISYTASALGETMTVEAERSDWGYAELDSNNSSSNEVMSGSGKLGDYEVEIKGAALASDYEGNPAIVITYAWTNNSDDTKSSLSCVLAKAFQDGVELENAIIADDSVFDSSSYMKDVRPGTTIDIQNAFILTSETSTVEVEISELISFSDDCVRMDFEPGDLQ